jgi:hypothetical protein
MTTGRETVPLPEFGNLPEKFFENHPSRLYVSSFFQRAGDTDVGRQFLGSLREKFPLLVSKRHSARADVADVSVLTTEATLDDRMVSRGTLPVTAAMFSGAFSPIAYASMAVRNRGIFSGMCGDVRKQLDPKPETVVSSSDK